MKLRTPPYPEILGTATYFGMQALHRTDAVRDAAALIREAHLRHSETEEGKDWAVFVEPHWEWVIESLIQGAYLREYHEWEKATKAYFSGQHLFGGGQAPTWRENLPGVSAASHVDRVRAQLALFGATASVECITAIDETRTRVNRAKHDSDTFASEQDLDLFALAIQDFWDALGTQEEFTPPSLASDRQA